MDPAFLYCHTKKLKGWKMFRNRGFSYTFIHGANGFGNVILPYDLNYRENQEAIEGQHFDKLGPGESHETIVVSEEYEGKQLNQDMVWRLKLRKGLIRSGKGVATVIGVRFGKQDVRDA